MTMRSSERLAARLAVAEDLEGAGLIRADANEAISMLDVPLRAHHQTSANCSAVKP